MINQAKLINEKLGVKVLDEADSTGKTAIQFSKKELKQHFIDDLLMNVKGKTIIKSRLHNLRYEVMNEAMNEKA